MKDFFKKADAVFTIAKQVPACVVAFKAQDYQNNPTKIIDLSVSISKKLEADYGLKGNALEYLKSFVTDSIKTFDLISADINKRMSVNCRNFKIFNGTEEVIKYIIKNRFI